MESFITSQAKDKLSKGRSDNINFVFPSSVVPA